MFRRHKRGFAVFKLIINVEKIPSNETRAWTAKLFRAVIYVTVTQASAFVSASNILVFASQAGAYSSGFKGFYKFCLKILHLCRNCIQ